MVQITASFIDQLKILPRLMMLAVTILTYQSVHWFMSIPHDQINAYNAGLVSVCMGAFTGCFGIWMGKEAKTDRGGQ
jgi:hypothetical protein